jgi:NTE family protein
MVLALALIAYAVPVGLSTAADAAEAANRVPGSRPTVGLVLSGGGALGATHIGVLKVLEEIGVPIDIVTGTSMGAIVGGLYAMGIRASELEGLVGSIDWARTLTDAPPRADRPFRVKSEDYGFLLDLRVGIKDGGVQLPAGLIQSQRLTLMLRALTLRARGITHFDDLPIRYRAVAADLETGQAVVLDRGNLATAMRASMSVPGVFPPVELDDRLLVDGGVANNLPVDVARAMGADVLIVVDIPSILKKRGELTSAVDIAGQMLTVLIQQNSLPQLASLGSKDILIQPDLGTMGSGDFGRIMDAVAPGEAAARRQADRLARLAADPVAYVGPTGAQPHASGTARTTPTPTPTGAPSGVSAAATASPATVLRRGEFDRAGPMQEPVIAFIEIRNRTRLDDRRIRNTIRQKIGEPLDVAQVEADFTRLYGQGDFEQIDYALVERDGRTGMVVTATEKRWARNYVRAGLALEHDLNGNSTYQIGAGLSLNALNSYGGEFRGMFSIGSDQALFAEFNQPLQPEPGLFAAATIDYSRTDVTAWDGDRRTAQRRVYAGGAALYLGHEIDTMGEVRLGLRTGRGQVERLIGAGRPDDFSFTIGQVIAQLAVDTLDNVGFPSQGQLALVNIAHSDGVLGASSDYTKLTAFANHAFSFGRNRFVAGVRGGTALGGDLPVYDQFTAGGLFSVSGYSRDSISTANILLGRLVYVRALQDTLPLAFDLPLYLGASLEPGIVDDGPFGQSFGRHVLGTSLFAGADTPLGPVYLGFGQADGGRRAAYLYFGKLF